MKTDINELRKRIAQLYPKRDKGDLTEKDFQREVAEQTVELYRAVISERMAEGETIECEHHTIWTHFRLMQSILREPAQQAISLFLTNRRLFRLQSTIMPDQPPTADSRDNTSVDAISLDRIHSLKKKIPDQDWRSVAWGRILRDCRASFTTGFRSRVPVLVALGVLGILHALLLPTRWIEVQTVDMLPAN